MAEWLNSSFSQIDFFFARIFNDLAISAGSFFTPFFKIVSFFGDKGLFFIALSIVLILFKKTRKVGINMILAIGIGALFTNVLIKNLVARGRPYTTSAYQDFWKAVGSVVESEKSFPSGHATVTMSAMTALFLTCNKKWSFIGFLFTALVCASRIYLVVHYFTDVLGGVIVGGLSATIAFFVVKRIFSLVIKNQDKKFCAFFLNADILNVFKKKAK